MTTLYIGEVLHVAQFTWAAYGVYNSYIAIRNLQQYEETTKTAAKFSTEAERQLHYTRTTQTAGVVAVSLAHLMSKLNSV